MAELGSVICTVPGCNCDVEYRAANELGTPSPPTGTIVVDNHGVVGTVWHGKVRTPHGQYPSWGAYVRTCPGYRIAVPLTGDERTMIVNALLRDAWTHEYDDDAVHALASRIEGAEK